MLEFFENSSKNLTHRLILKVKVLAAGKFQVVAAMAGNECPSEKFILQGQANTLAMRQGLMIILQYVATNGLSTLPYGWSHEASKEDGIFEFIKGDLRLFYFKGVGNQIAVCTSGALKKQSKADKKSVNKAAKFKDEYFAAIDNDTCEVINDENEQGT